METRPVVTQEERDVALDLIQPHPRQPRLDFDRESIDRLAESLKDPDVGLLQRILVRPKGERFELLAGERRCRAARLASWTTIPAIVRLVDDKTALKILLVENLEREPLCPIEQAYVLSELRRPIGEGGVGMTTEQIGAEFHRSRKWVEGKLALLSLKEPWRSRLIAGDIDESKAELILHYNDQPAVQEAIREAIEGNPEAWRTRAQWRANVRSIEQRVNKTAAPKSSKAKPPGAVEPPSRRSKRTTKTTPPVLDRTLTDADVTELLRPFAYNRGDLRAIRDSAQRMLDRIADRQAQTS